MRSESKVAERRVRQRPAWRSLEISCQDSEEHCAELGPTFRLKNCEVTMSSFDQAQDKAIREPIRLEPYDANWPTSYAAERARLVSLFPLQLRAVEHIGSTAIPQMLAKPIVDILAGVDSMSVADSLVEEVLRHGYTTSRLFNEALTDRRWFMRSIDGRRTHHLHVVVFASPTWLRHLLFRDRLRSNPALAQSYGSLKSELALRFEHDREAYTNAKSEFVASVLGIGQSFAKQVCSGDCHRRWN